MIPFMADDIRGYLTHALRIVDETGDWIRERTRSSFTVNRKADDSFVTEIDLEVERRIRQAITDRWPDHAVLGEEDGITAGAGEFRWIIDPIDGTMSLRSGIPLYGTIVSLYHRDAPLIGIIQLPALNRCYWAGAGIGTFCNGEQLRITDSPDPLAEVIAVGDRSQFVRADLERELDLLMTSHPWVRTYPDCFGHALAAEGSAGAMFDVDLKEWDVSATRLLIEEAGGRFERLKSKRPDRWNVVFGKPAVVDWIRQKID